jgi:hypothetical protein
VTAIQPDTTLSGGSNIDRSHTRDDHDDDLLLEETMVNERKRLDEQVANRPDAKATKQQVVKALAPLVSTVPNIEKMGGAEPPGATSARKPFLVKVPGLQSDWRLVNSRRLTGVIRDSAKRNVLVDRSPFGLATS